MLEFAEITQSLQLVNDGIDSHAVICEPLASNVMSGQDMRDTVDKLLENVGRPTAPETSPAVEDHMVVAEKATFESAALVAPKFVRACMTAAVSAATQPKAAWQAVLAQDVISHCRPSQLARAFWETQRA